MSEPAPSTAPTGAVIAPAELAFSCRLPLLVFFISAAIWLLLASVFGILASIKFHAPGFLADSAWLTYGRVWPAYINCLVYGCCLQAGLGITLWVLTHLGLTPLVQRELVTIGAAFWNLGVTLGVLGILAGYSTGFPNLEMPGYATIMMSIGYLLVGVWAVLTFHRRRERRLFVSQWFLFAALFWFPWIYSTAQLLLVAYPVRGVAQAVIDWWYVANLRLVWLGLVGLAAIFYFIPKLLERELHSHYLALFTFWMLVLFGSWTGIPNTAPVPAWMPTASTIATVLLLVPILAVATNIHRTVAGSYSKLTTHPSLLFLMFAVAAFVVAGLMNVAAALLDSNQLLHFTWFARAQQHLNLYGFFVMAVFGAAYRILPQLTATELPWPRLARTHFWIAAAGVLLLVVPFAIAGVNETFQMLDVKLGFISVSRSTLPFLRVSTVGELLLALGHLLFAANLIGLTVRFYQTRAAAVLEEATADLFKPAGAKP